MNTVPLQTTALAAPIGGGETAVFYVLGIVMLLAALGVVFSRRAVYSAIMMAVVMISLAVFYGINEAPFLMVVQIVVYTGAVLMLFLFVLMLVGVGSTDSLVETIKGQRLLTAVIALCFFIPLTTGLTAITVGEPIGLAAGVAAAGGNIPWIASEIIYRYIIAFEATGALLITAILGALVLAHMVRTKKKRTQRQMAQDRVRDGHVVGSLPGPGTYARHNSIDMPALLPDGSVSELSLNPVLVARSPEEQRDVPEDMRHVIGAAPGGGSDAARSTESRQSGEPGSDAPSGKNDDGNGEQEDKAPWTR